MARPLLSASILSADFGRLADQVQAAEAAGVDWIHVDVMDGHFVPNLTLGPPVIAAIRRATKLPLDVHLMISNPEHYLKQYVEAGADWLGVHVEVAWHLERLLQQIKELGVKATVTLNPATPLSSLEVILPTVDMVLLMTVNPGFGGQEFIPATWPKIRRLRQQLDALPHPPLLQVDGGVKLSNIAALRQAGVDVFVAGSAIFGDGDITGNVRRLREALEESAPTKLSD